ncbi:MAG: sigma-70 family RNA polymerase sigma factor [Planctomycetes bacterium]|nr:sigma-70 family RNA polymerase sigma factor [Planctomycetota bacterium]
MAEEGRSESTEGSSRKREEFRELMDRIAAGDESAAEEVVRLYEPYIRRFVRFRLTDVRVQRLIDSVDVSQSVFLRLFQGLQRGALDVEGPEQLKALLTTIARNRLRDRTRRVRSDRRGGKWMREAFDLPAHQAMSSEGDPGQIVENRDLRQCLTEELDAHERRLFERWLAGKTWAEIAKEVGGTREALRKRLMRAIASASVRLGLRTKDHE